MYFIIMVLIFNIPEENSYERLGILQKNFLVESFNSCKIYEWKAAKGDARRQYSSIS